MTIELNFTYAIDGFFDSVNYYRSETPMDPESMPVATATGITGLTYTDTTATKGLYYYVRFGSVKGTTEKISDEIYVFASAYRSTILADNPVAYYPLNETTETIATDIMSSPANGSVLNCSVGQTHLFPALGNSYYFNGTNSRIELGSPSKFLISGSASMEAWFKAEDSTLKGNIFAIGYNQGLRMQIDSSAVLIFDNAGVLYSASLSSNVVYHIVFTCTSSHLKIYINSDLSASLLSTNWSGISSVSDSAIGFAGASFGEYFKGYISNVALYNYELTDAQVLAHYNAGAV